jgi:hypothetical protein
MQMNEIATVQNESKSFTVSITVAKAADDVLDSIKNFRGWWSEEIEGNTDKLNETFFYHYKDIHLCRIKMIEEVPGKKLVYHVVDNKFNFIEDQTEWVNTHLIFDLESKAGTTQLTFTHEGLVSECECYQVCNDAWTGYITKSLKNLIETGKGNPNPRDKDGFNAELAEKWGLK